MREPLTALTKKFTIQHCQMGIMRHRSEHNRYSAAYATGREFGIDRLTDWRID